MNRILMVLVGLLMLANCSGSGSSGNDNVSGAIPSGAFWCTVTVSAPECIPVEGAPDVEVCGSKEVKQVEIVEESTAEILGMCSFDAGDTATTGTVPSGYRFWCERLATDGGTQIKVSSNQANLPTIHVYWGSTDGSPGGILYEEYAQPSALNGPDGTVYTDPYEEVSFTFAGYKKLVFHAKDKDYAFMQDKALAPLRDAGYEASMTFSADIAEVSVYDTLDGRAKMTENTLH